MPDQHYILCATGLPKALEKITLSCPLSVASSCLVCTQHIAEATSRMARLARKYLSQARAVVALWSLRARLAERGQKPYLQDRKKLNRQGFI
jgi:hypothetical protein